jgi:hypothetical protein
MIQKLIIIPLVIILTLGLTYSQSSISSNIDKVLKQLNIQKKDCYYDLVVEQIIPYASDKSVVVIPKIIDKDENSFSCDCYILIINNASGLIINRFFESNSLISDAVRIEKISVDFAPYRLNSTTRAFGIRILNEGDSRPNPYENEDISLFIPKDSLLVRVLRNYSISSITGDWDTNCSGQFVTQKKILIMSNKITNNYYDIIAKSKITTTNMTFVNNDCKDIDTVKNKTCILKFDNNEYK